AASDRSSYASVRSAVAYAASARYGRAGTPGGWRARRDARGGKMIPSGRDGHGERASAPALALHLDATAVQTGHLVHETIRVPSRVRPRQDVIRVPPGKRRCRIERYPGD